MALSYAQGEIQWATTDAVSTTFTVSGLSFQPKAIRFNFGGYQSASTGGSSTTHINRGVGFAASTSSRRCVVSYSEDGAGSAVCSGVEYNDCIAARISNTTLDGKLDLNSITSDGFTLIVDDQLSIAGLSIFWEAWGGDDITNVTVGDIAEPAATGTQDYTATGFTSTDDDSQVVMLAGVQATSAIGTAQGTDSGFFIGYTSGTATAENIATTGNSDDGSATIDTDSWAGTGTCVAHIPIAGGTPNSATAILSAFGTDLFTLNWTVRTTTNRRSIYMAIKGGNWRVGATTIANAASSTATISGLPFGPIGVLFAQHSAQTSGTGTWTGDHINWGAAGKTPSAGHSMSNFDQDAQASSVVGTYIHYTAPMHTHSSFTPGSLGATFNINAWNTDGFQIILSTGTPSNGLHIGYLTFGNPPAGGGPMWDYQPFQHILVR
jgi:hypothetical protein